MLLCVSEAAVSDIKMSSCIVATPATFNVLDKVAAPMTPSVPPAVRSPTAVLPVPGAAVNAVVAAFVACRPESTGDSHRRAAQRDDINVTADADGIRQRPTQHRISSAGDGNTTPTRCA